MGGEGLCWHSLFQSVRLALSWFGGRGLAQVDFLVEELHRRDPADAETYGLSVSVSSGLRDLAPKGLR
eukprot:4390154-Amphidinium_carterae.1